MMLHKIKAGSGSVEFTKKYGLSMSDFRVKTTPHRWEGDPHGLPESVLVIFP